MALAAGPEMESTTARRRVGPARFDEREGPLFGILFLFLVLGLPSVAINVPGLPEFARTTDLVGLLCLAVYIRHGGVAGPGERKLLLFLAGTIAISIAALLVLSAFPSYAESIRTRNMLYPLRNLFMYAPALLAFHLYVSRRNMAKYGAAFTALGVLATLAMAVAYDMGATAFDAHQTLETAAKEGTWTVRVNRLGGLVGETGAFGFHAVLVYQLMLVFLFLGGWRRLGFAATAAMLGYVVYVYIQCQTRISLANGLIFLMILLWSRDLVTRRAAVMGTGAALAGAVILLAPIMMSPGGLMAELARADLTLFARFQGMLGGPGGGESALDTSGRVDHWIAVSEMIVVNPLFGYGSRTSALVLGHAVENFALQALVDYGVVVFALQVSFLWWIRRKLNLGDLPRIPAYRRELQAGAVLKAALMASFLQWQLNDIVFFFQAFPMVAMATVLFIRHVDRVREALHDGRTPLA